MVPSLYKSMLAVTGNMVRRVFELRKELLEFYAQRNHYLINLKLPL